MLTSRISKWHENMKIVIHNSCMYFYNFCKTCMYEYELEHKYLHKCVVVWWLRALISVCGTMLATQSQCGKSHCHYHQQHQRHQRHQQHPHRHVHLGNSPMGADTVWQSWLRSQTGFSQHSGSSQSTRPSEQIIYNICYILIGQLLEF